MAITTRQMIFLTKFLKYNVFMIVWHIVRKFRGKYIFKWNFNFEVFRMNIWKISNFRDLQLNFKKFGEQIEFCFGDLYFLALRVCSPKFFRSVRRTTTKKNKFWKFSGTLSFFFSSNCYPFFFSSRCVNFQNSLFFPATNENTQPWVRLSENYPRNWR